MNNLPQEDCIHCRPGRLCEYHKPSNNPQSMTDYEITEEMIVRGGSFANRLAFAWRAADHENQARLKAAFPELWAKYAELARLRQIQTQR